MNREGGEVGLLPPFDFSGALGVSESEQVDRALACFRSYVEAEALQQYFEAELVPLAPGSAADINGLEAELGVELPCAYSYFLSRCRYAVLGDGVQVWGLDWQGESYGSPWLSTEHLGGERFVVFGYYWRYADGDQLLLAVDRPGVPVILYLHEHGPVGEAFAPSFSLALWRLAYERSG